MSDIEIRPLMKADAEKYRAHRLEMLKDAPQAFGAAYEEVLKEDICFFEASIEKSTIIGVFEEDMLIASGGYTVDNRNKKKHIAFIWGIYVTPLARGRGLAKKILAELESSLSSSIRVIHINVESSNKTAYYIYKKFNYAKWGLEEKAFFIDGQFFNVIHMVKFLP